MLHFVFCLLAARKRDSEGITKQYPDKIPVSGHLILAVLNFYKAFNIALVYVFAGLPCFAMLQYELLLFSIVAILCC